MSSRARFRHRLKSGFSKPKSANDSDISQITLVDLNDASVKCSTPYRLPRISPAPAFETPTPVDDQYEGEERVFGRYGYEDVIRMPELGPSISKALINPHSTLAKRYRQAGIHVMPQFKHAAITPTSFAPHCIEDEHVFDYHDEEDFDQQSIMKSVEFTRLTNSLSASRSVSPSKSVKSIHWALGQEKNPMFDKAGQSRAQGPFSREFRVRCMAPPNWLRMKLGRHRTMVH